jgi:arsenate reductase
VTDGPVRVLVLCTGNSCRSIMAEALFRELGGDQVVVDSAGSRPSGVVNPLTLRTLDEAGLAHGWARSKSMTEFLDEPFDHVLTVCDDAAEACPTFPGPARRTHWSIADPSHAVGTDAERMAAFRATFADLRQRITTFLRENAG